jgi:hypothetical protein
VVGKAVVLAGDHRALEVVGNLVIRQPLLAPAQGVFLGGHAPGFGALKGGGLRVDDQHGDDAQHKIQLQQHQGESHQAEPAPNRFHGVTPK